MKIRKGTDPVKLVRMAQSVGGEVSYLSGEGDRLDLKSALSQFVFTSEVSRRGADPGELICEREEDYEKLREFLEQ